MSEELDIIVAGAGLSGIDAAYRVMTQCRGRTFAVLESRATLGGTWDLFRYPGVRSDSDMFTLGYPFHPWKQAKAIADGPSILDYVRETAEKFGISPLIRYRHRVVAARWSSADARWTVDVEVGEERRLEQLRCRFLYLCCGYYDYAAAHAPELPGIAQFQGRVVHPQWWPKDFEYAGQRVVVIGSGATAVTLVPAMSATARHVTMLQRSPSYMAALPDRDRVADFIRAVLPDELAHGLIRVKNVLFGLSFFLLAKRRPKLAARILLRWARRLLPEGYPLEQHFTPRYDPWDQRLCVVPNGDLFEAISSGRASVVTDTIETFTRGGIRLASGAELEADVVVTATGLKVLPIGGVRVSLDGRAVQPHEALVYKGMMLGDVPNLAWCVGYTNASWTLRADLSARYFCRLINFMELHGYDIAAPRSELAGQRRTRLLNLKSGYLDRAISLMPQQGGEAPWIMPQNYVVDFFSMVFGAVDDGAMAFSRLAVSPQRPRLPEAAETPAHAP